MPQPGNEITYQPNSPIVHDFGTSVSGTHPRMFPGALGRRRKSSVAMRPLSLGSAAQDGNGSIDKDSTKQDTSDVPSFSQQISHDMSQDLGDASDED